MRILTLMFGLFFVMGSALGQNHLQKDEFQLNAGLGFSGWGIPVYTGLDYGIHEDISIGGELSYRSYNDSWSGHGYDHSVIGVLGNGNYHFNRILKIPQPWDFYAGLNIGFYIWNSPSDYEGSHSSGLGLGAQVGGRYYVTKTIGINLELGGGNTDAGGKIGVSIKL
jgi:outer membrane immunogenic protein